MSRDDDRNVQDDVPYEDYEELAEELELYREASEDSMQLLDWAIGYLYGIRKYREAQALSKGRQVIRTNLLGKHEQVTPADEMDAA